MVRSALVEEAARGSLGWRHLVGSHFDMRRRQQEHLAGDPLDGAVQTKHQAGSEVDETLGVCVIQIGQVHDHRGALAETLADVLGFVVRSRMDRRDTVQRTDFDITDDPSHGCACWQGRYASGTFVADGNVLTGGGLVVVVVRLVAVVTLVLGQPEVHHGLAQCPCHLELLTYGLHVIGLNVIRLCMTFDECSPQNYPNDGREPRIALPTRRCVAPFATAASRSALIPAEIQVAAGWAERSSRATAASSSKAAAGSTPSGATAISPRSVRCAAAATAAASPATPSTGIPPRPPPAESP